MANEDECVLQDLRCVTQRVNRTLEVCRAGVPGIEMVGWRLCRQPRWSSSRSVGRPVQVTGMLYSSSSLLLLLLRPLRYWFDRRRSWGRCLAPLKVIHRFLSAPIILVAYTNPASKIRSVLQPDFVKRRTAIFLTSVRRRAIYFWWRVFTSMLTGCHYKTFTAIGKYVYYIRSNAWGKGKELYAISE